MIVEKEKTNMKKGNGIALLPIGVFLVLYLGLGILFEYVLKIPMGFYNVPKDTFKLCLCALRGVAL